MRKGVYRLFSMIYEEGGLRGWILVIEYFDFFFFFFLPFVLISLIVETVMFSCGSN